MIKLLVVSDSHLDTILLNKVYLKHQNCDYFLHLGDSCLPSYALNNFSSVLGNCDFDNYPLNRTIHTQYGNIFLEHGNNGKYTDINYIKSKNCLIYLYGHTHVKCFKKIDNIYIINPGSLSRPRDDTFGSYAIVTIDENTVDCKFFCLDSL